MEDLGALVWLDVRAVRLELDGLIKDGGRAPKELGDDWEAFGSVCGEEGGRSEVLVDEGELPR